MEIRLEGRAVLVTGASSGIGAAIARAIAGAGADVALVGRDRDRLRATADDVETAGRRAALVVADLEDDGAAQRVVDDAMEALGRIDAVVNCAGVFLTGPVEESAATFDRQWRTNVRAPFRLTVAALPELRRRRGSIVFLSSIAGKIGFPNASAYCATKGAIELATKALAVEEAPNGVRVNAIAPGNVETPMNAHLMADADYYKAMIEATPLGRNAQVDDIAPIAVLLVSDAGAYITGESIVVDGGWTAR
jgi:NAD(P)-dependent dehydrogenase (short-subunit alcohol dehydrogenase family)